MDGLGLVMLGMILLCIIVPVSILSGVILSFAGVPLIYRLRGVPKDKRRFKALHKLALSILLTLVSGVVITVGGWVFLSYGHTWFSSPEEIFQEAVGLPLPESVEIVNALDGPGISINQWLHFKCTSQDIDNILAADKYVENTNFSFDFSWFNPPSWWQPESMGDGIVIFEGDEYTEEKKYMLVNSQKNEVFFLNYIY